MTEIKELLQRRINKAISKARGIPPHLLHGNALRLKQAIKIINDALTANAITPNDAIKYAQAMGIYKVGFIDY